MREINRSHNELETAYLLSPGDVAAYLKLPVQEVRRRIRENRIPGGVMKGHYLMVNRSEMLQALELKGEPFDIERHNQQILEKLETRAYKIRNLLYQGKTFSAIGKILGLDTKKIIDIYEMTNNLKK